MQTRSTSDIQRSIECADCGGHYWYVRRFDSEAECTNCRHTREYHTQSARDGKEHGTTDSQEKKLDAARRFAEEHAKDNWEMEVDHLDWGPASVTLVLDPESVTRLRIDFFLTRRGKVELKSCSRYWGDSDPMASMFCRATNGHDERP